MLRPYGQPGQMPTGNYSCPIDWVKSSNFISWLLYNQCIRTSTCETVNKSGKSNYLLYRLWSFLWYVPNLESIVTKVSHSFCSIWMCFLMRNDIKSKCDARLSVLTLAFFTYRPFLISDCKKYVLTDPELRTTLLQWKMKMLGAN